MTKRRLIITEEMRVPRKRMVSVDSVVGLLRKQLAELREQMGKEMDMRQFLACEIAAGIIATVIADLEANKR